MVRTTQSIHAGLSLGRFITSFVKESEEISSDSNSNAFLSSLKRCFNDIGENEKLVKKPQASSL